MKKKLTKDYLYLIGIIFLINIQSFFFVDYYFPGTHLVVLVYLTFFAFKSNFESSLEKFKWIGSGFLAIVASQIILGILGVDLVLITPRISSLVSLIVLGIVSKKIKIQNNWKTYIIFFGVYFIEVVWSSVMVKQAYSSAMRIYGGGNPEHELFFINRFLNGIVYSIEIYLILYITKFDFTNKTEERKAEQEESA